MENTELQTELTEDLHEHLITPKKSQKLVVLVLIFFAIVATAGIAFYLGTQQGDTVVPPSDVTPVSSQTPEIDLSDDANWKTYDDSTLSLKAPPDFSEMSESSPFDQSQTPILSLSSNKSEFFAPNYSQESILVVSSSSEIPNYLKVPQENAQSLGEKEVNGNTFTVFTSQDAGAGNRYDSTIYRIIHNQTCFDIAFTVHSGSDWTGIDMTAVQVSIDNAKKEFNQILSTFKFTN